MFDDEDILEISQLQYHLEFEIERYIQFTNVYESFETTDYIFAGVNEVFEERMDTWFHRCKMTLRANMDDNDNQMKKYSLHTHSLL